MAYKASLICRKCGGPKKLRKAGKGIPYNYCPACSKTNGLRKLQTDYKARAYNLWRAAQERARKRQLEFTLNRVAIENWLIYGHCAVTGVKFEWRYFGHNNPLAPSLDRIDPRIGYTDSNCRLVSWIFNRAKGKDTDEDVFEMVRAIYAVKKLGST